MHYRIGVRAATEAGIALADWRASFRPPQRPPKRGVKLTGADLRRAGACRDGTRRFRAVFPRGLVITSEIVPVLIAGGLMVPKHIHVARGVMRTPAPLLSRAGCAIDQAHTALHYSRSLAAMRAVSHGTDEEPAVRALREAAWDVTSRMQHDGPDHARAAYRLRCETHDAISRYKDARLAARQEPAEARAAEWEAYTASLADWIERLNRDWWTAWADAVLATRET